MDFREFCQNKDSNQTKQNNETNGIDNNTNINDTCQNIFSKYSKLPVDELKNEIKNSYKNSVKSGNLSENILDNFYDTYSNFLDDKSKSDLLNLIEELKNEH